MSAVPVPSPEEQVMGLFMGVLHTRGMIAAAELGLADVLAGGPKPVERIAAETRTNAAYLFRLMRALETIGLFRQTAPSVFENTPMSYYLRSDVPDSKRAFIQLGAPGWAYWEGWALLTEALKTGRTALFDSWGYDIWEHYRRNPDQWTVFNEAMRSLTTQMTPAVTAAYHWGRFPVIADIAGGIGTQLVSILDAHPDSRGVLFEQPEVLAEAIPHDRVSHVSGSFFEEIPVEADAYVLRNIIHDWNDEAAGTILKTLRKSVKPDSRVCLVEWSIPEGPEFHPGKWFDLTMMTGVSGKERTRTEFAELYASAGFELEDVVPTPSMFSIVVGRPAA